MTITLHHRPNPRQDSPHKRRHVVLRSSLSGICPLPSHAVRSDVGSHEGKGMSDDSRGAFHNAR